MKNLMAKLKGLNYKQTVIDHGEKLFLGVIGLFVLICLAGTSWSRYDKQPEEFLKKVAQGEAAIKSSAWTIEKQNEFKTSRDIMQAVTMLHSPLDAGRYVYSTNSFWPMYPSAVKVSEPKWLAPVQPIADGGKLVVVEIPVDPLQGKDIAMVDGAPGTKKDDDDDDVVVPRTLGGAAKADAAAAPVAAPGTTGAGANDPAYKKMMTGTGMSGASEPAGPVVNARGMRFIAVRAVYPLLDQLDELVKAMHETKQKAAELIDFTDFEVERQVALPGDKPWSGEWEKVDLQASLELLEKVDYDTEVVSLDYTDGVLTMPLLKRVDGRRWAKNASHPLIKAMSEEQVELQAQLTQKMIEEAEKLKKEDKAGNKKGFFKSQHDGRALRNQFNNNQVQGMMQDVTKQMAGGTAKPFSSGFDTGAMRGMADGSAMNGFQDQMTRSNGRMSKYLLLRYFDFQVTPGNAYRYRMRVTLRNPNFKRPVEELVQEETAQRDVRESPWSEPTPHVYIANEDHIFLTRTDKAKIETGLPSAYLDVYQWFSEAGTTIAAKLEKLQLGQFVGGRPPKTEVFRPANNTLRDEEIPVFTGSVLADVVSASGSDLDFQSEHADLKLDAKKLKQLGLVDKALLVDRFGQLVPLDPKVSLDEQAQSQKIVEDERKRIRAAIKENPTQVAGTSDLDRLRKNAGAADDPMGNMSKMMGAGQSSPLKKGGATKGAGKAAPPRKPKGAAGAAGANAGM